MADKNIWTIYVLFGFLLSISSLHSGCTNEKDYTALYGRWKYTDKDGDNKELWINQHQVILISEATGDERSFSYEIAQDTLKLLKTIALTQKREVAEMVYIKEISKIKLTLILHEDFEVECYRMDRGEKGLSAKVSSIDFFDEKTQ